LNGVGWALLQNWMWAARLWPGVHFNWWRAWETSGGISIGIAYGVAYYLVNRRVKEEASASQESAAGQTTPSLGWLAAFLISALLIGTISLEVMPMWCSGLLTLAVVVFSIAYYAKARNTRASYPPCGPGLERWGAYTGLLLGLGLSIKNGLGGCLSIYCGTLDYWDDVFMVIIGPLMILALIVVSARIFLRPRPAGPRDDPFPHAYGLVWLVLLVQYVLALLISAPLTNWNEVVFAIYYVLLFFITAVIILHYHAVRKHFGRDSGDTLLNYAIDSDQTKKVNEA
jgi:hypothetical protein